MILYLCLSIVLRVVVWPIPLRDWSRRILLLWVMELRVVHSLASLCVACFAVRALVVKMVSI